MKLAVQLVTSAFLAAATFSPAQALIVGTADTGNGIPFGVNAGYYFQQIYNASSFGSGINITQLSFYNTQYPGGSPRPGNFELYLSYLPTSVNIATFDTNTSVSWLDGSFVQVFSGSAPALANGRLDFNLTTAFNYDPTQGNLLLTVRELTLGGTSIPSIFLDADNNNGLTNIRYSQYPYDSNFGLVTGFNDGPTEAPDPTPIPAVGAGVPLLIGAGALLRRFRRRRAA